jgi:hemolysin activation/secretion protein
MLTVSSNYLKVQPTFFGGYFTQVGENASANVRYVAPFGLRDWRCEVSGEADFKQTNNNLAFGGTSVLATKTDLFAVTLGAVGLRDDARGRWAVSCSVTGSPGNVNSRNGDDAYQMSREGSRARYLRGQIRLQRAQRLTPTMTTSVQVVTQFASANLLASEQLSVGGAMSVRGYHERVFAGDEGVLLTHEVEHQLLNRAVAKRLPPLGVSAVYFWDFGRVFIKHPLLLEPPAHSISSAGVGLRVGMGANFSASIDYGRQLIDSQMPGAGRGRLHTRLTLAF